MIGAIPFWIHLIAAAVWIGSQVMMFTTVTPSLRLIESPAVRGLVMRSVTRRFGYLGWGALLILILTGLGNVADRDDLYQPVGVFDFGFRYAWLLTTKLALTVVVVLLTAWHTFVHGPRLLRELEATGGGRPTAAAEARIGSMRRLSIIVSVVNLIIALGIIYLVTLMQDFEFAFEEL